MGRAFPTLDVACLALRSGQAGRGIRVGRQQIGMAAVDAVVAQLARGERGVPKIPKRVLIEGVWEE